MSMSVFDDWPDRYRQWFDTPLGAVIKRVEIDLVMSMLQPNDRHHVLDAGC